MDYLWPAKGPLWWKLGPLWKIWGGHLPPPPDPPNGASDLKVFQKHKKTFIANFKHVYEKKVNN